MFRQRSLRLSTTILPTFKEHTIKDLIEDKRLSSEIMRVSIKAEVSGKVFQSEIDIKFSQGAPLLSDLLVKDYYSVCSCFVAVLSIDFVLFFSFFFS
jgi:hypothetical protein